VEHGAGDGAGMARWKEENAENGGEEIGKEQPEEREEKPRRIRGGQDN